MSKEECLRIMRLLLANGRMGVNEISEKLALPEYNVSKHLRVMKDALSLGKGSSDLLLPKVDLGQLMPDAAHRWLQAQGATVHTHSRVTDLDGLNAQPVLLACPAWEAAKLVSPIDPAWAAQEIGRAHV